MRRKPPINEFRKRKPSVKEINAAKRMAKEVSPRLLKLMEAKNVTE